MDRKTNPIEQLSGLLARFAASRPPERLTLAAVLTALPFLLFACAPGLVLSGGTGGIAVSPPSVEQFMGVGEMGADIAVDMLVLMPSSVTLRIFEVFVEVGPSGHNDTWTATLMKNGNATPMSCTIPSSDVHRCASHEPVSFAAGDTIFVRIVSTGAPPATPFHWRALTSTR